MLARQVKSSDGLVTLDVPAGALAGDTKIAIVAARDDELPKALAGVRISKPVYRLLPDGLKFNAPVPISIRLPSLDAPDGTKAITLPSLTFFTFDPVNGFEPIGENWGTPEQTQHLLVRKSGEVAIEGSVRHFSFLVGSDGGLEFSLEMLPGPHALGAHFEADFTIRNQRQGWDLKFDYTVTLSSIRGQGSIRPDPSRYVRNILLATADPNTRDVQRFGYQCDPTQGSGTGRYGAEVEADVAFDATPFRELSPTKLVTGDGEVFRDAYTGPKRHIFVVSEAECGLSPDAGADGAGGAADASGTGGTGGAGGMGGAAPPGPMGAPCTSNSGCLSRACTDGVCCNEACILPCLACTAAKKGSGVDGVCGQIAAGTNLDKECTGVAACYNGLCGLPPGTPCIPKASPEYKPPDCGGSVCAWERKTFAPICCNSLCTLGCHSCRNADTGMADGICAPIIKGTDPYNECADPKPSCNGANTCE